jgi:hypothetical protein
VGQFPIEDGAQATGPDKQIAHPEVTVDGDLTVRCRTVDVQPPDTELEAGPHLS